MRNAKLTLLGSGKSSGPATEIVRPNTDIAVYGTATGGATGHAVLSDSSDSSYVASANFSDKDGTFTRCGWNGGFSDLVAAGGRNVASFTVTFRAEATVGLGNVSQHDFYPLAGIITSVSHLDFTPPASVGNSTTTAFTKNGGGTWTESQFNTLTGQGLFASTEPGTFTGRLYEVFITVTYA